MTKYRIVWFYPPDKKLISKEEFNTREEAETFAGIELMQFENEGVLSEVVEVEE